MSLYPYQLHMLKILLKAHAEGRPVVVNYPRRMGRATVMRAVTAEQLKMQGQAPTAVVLDELEAPITADNRPK